MDNSPILSLPYVRASQVSKEITLNEALTLLEAAVQLVVEAEQDVPPEDIVPGKRYIVAAGASEAWASYAAGTVVVAVEGGWRAFTPLEGWTAYDIARQSKLAYVGGIWKGDGAGLGSRVSVDASSGSATIEAVDLLASASVFVDASASSSDAAVALPSGVSGLRYFRIATGIYNVDIGGVTMAPDDAAWLWLDGYGTASR